MYCNDVNHSSFYVGSDLSYWRRRASSSVSMVFVTMWLNFVFCRWPLPWGVLQYALSHLLNHIWLFWKLQWRVLLSADCQDKEQDVQCARCQRYGTDNFWVLLSFTWFHIIMLSLCSSRWFILLEINIKILKGMCFDEIGWFIKLCNLHSFTSLIMKMAEFWFPFVSAVILK